MSLRWPTARSGVYVSFRCAGGPPVTNIRNTYWRAWLKPENRCLLPEVALSQSRRPDDDKSARVEITRDIVAEALARAARAKDLNELYDYYDTSQRYLILRQRGPRAGWFVRAQ